jgi:hypothetical protein
MTSCFVLQQKCVSFAFVAMKKNKRHLYTSTFLSLCHRNQQQLARLVWFHSRFLERRNTAAATQEENEKIKAKPSLRFFFFQNKLELSIDIKPRRFQDGFVTLLYWS